MDAGRGDPLAEAFFTLSQEAKELYLPAEVPRIEVPSPLEFYRDFVAPNKPVIITNALRHWGACRKWTNEYLKNTLGEAQITVDISPSGFSDAITATDKGERFVTPDVRQMTFAQFLEIFHSPSFHGVPYIQHQNGNFSLEFEKLWEDIEPSGLTWASEAFGLQPDAVNFWLGDSRSVTSLHKDHYENIYCVIAGEKHFTLFPPTDILYLYETKYKAAHYQENEGKSGYDVIDEEPESFVPWIPVDPDKEFGGDAERFKHYDKASPLRCVVHEGEVLYLPSLWFHHVKQRETEGRCIAVNFWYDMDYGIKYNYFKFMENIIEIRKSRLLEST